MDSNEFNEFNDFNDLNGGVSLCLPSCVLKRQPHLAEPIWEKAVSELPECDGLEMAELATNLFVTERVLLLRNWTPKGAKNPFFFHINSPLLTRNLILVEDDRIFRFVKAGKILDDLQKNGVIKMRSLGSLFFPGNDGDVVLTTYKKFYGFLAANPVSVFGLWPDVLTFCYDSYGISAEAVAVLRMLSFDSVMTKVIFSSPVDIPSLPEFIRNMSEDSLVLSEKLINSESSTSSMEYYYETLTKDIVVRKLRRCFDGSLEQSVTSLVYCRDQSQALGLSITLAKELPGVKCFTLTKTTDMASFVACENELGSLSSWILILDNSCRGYLELSANVVVDFGEVEAGTAYFGWKQLYRTLHGYEFVTSKQIYAADSPEDKGTKVYLAKIGIDTKSLPKFISGRATELMNWLGYHYGND